MMYANIFGTPIYCGEDGVWKLEATHELLDNIDQKQLKCPKCHLVPTKEGHDPCIANLPNVRFACCGHGITEPMCSAYIYFESGETVYFNTTEELFQYIEDNNIR